MAAPKLIIDVINSNLFRNLSDLTSNVTLSQLGYDFLKIRGGDIPFFGNKIAFSEDNINEYYNIFEQSPLAKNAKKIGIRIKDERKKGELFLGARGSSGIKLLESNINNTWELKGGLLTPIQQSEKVKSTIETSGSFFGKFGSNLDPKFDAEVSHSDIFNENIALVYLFTLWLREQQSALKIIDEISKELDKEDYSLLKLKALQAILDARKSEKLTTKRVKELIKGLQERISTARALVSSSRFDKQRYLLQQLPDLSNLSKRRFGHDKDQRPAPAIGFGPDFYLQPVGNITYDTQTRIVRFINSNKNPINKLTGASVGAELFKMSTEQLSKLVPKIQIFKTIYNEKMEVDREVEFKFPTGNTEIGDIFNYDPNFANKAKNESPKNFSKTKGGYGIQSFTWKYEGSDPFSVDRDISATLELYFQDFSEFTALRGSSKCDGYRYIDLIVPLEKDYDGLKGAAAKSFEQDIRIEAGWEIPNTFEKSLADAIKGSQINIKLSMVDYNISFSGNGNGASTITINYTARMEAVGRNRLVNVIAATKKQHKEIERLEDLIRSKEPEDIKKRKETREEQQKELETVRQESSKVFIDKLFDKSSIYWRKLNVASVLQSAVGPNAATATYETLFPTRGAYKPSYEDGLKADLEGGLSYQARPLIEDFLDEGEGKDENIKILNPEKVIYTFFGDIIDTALEIAVESGNFLGAPVDAIKNLKLGTLDFRVGESTYNLADLPIELGVFIEFLQNKIGKRNEATKSIVSFISELLADVITNKIDTLFNLQDGTTRSFKIGYTDLNKDLKPSTIHEYDLNKKRDIEEILKAPKGDYLIIYSDSPLPSEFLIKKGEYNCAKNKDEENGLHHFTLGATHSLVKNISFDKVDLEYARERRLSINKEDPYALLSNVFNVNISLFGNDYFKPGSYIYVDPKVMGEMGNPYTKGTIANLMGLGGYHIVTKVQNSIASNSYSTTIDAVWETSGDGIFSMNESRHKKRDKKESEDAKTDSE